MYKVLLLPLVLVVAACGAPEPEPTLPAVTERDWTLPLLPSSLRAEAGRPVEVGRPTGQHASRRARKPRPAPFLLEPLAIPIHYEPLPIVPIPLGPAGQSPFISSETADEHELLPGKTVMVVPSSSGPP